MYCWSVLSRSSTSIHRFPTAQRFHSRRFAAKTPPVESSHLQSSRNDHAKSNILRWISAGIITSSTLALSLYSFSPSSLDSPTTVSFADWSTQPPAASLSQSALSKSNEESKFLFGDAYRKKVFFNYERRIRMRSPPEKMVKLEFAHYDFKLRGTISAKDFALSMVASADMKNLNKLLDRVDDLDNEPRLDNIRITPEEFKNFSELRKSCSHFLWHFLVLDK